MKLKRVAYVENGADGTEIVQCDDRINWHGLNYRPQARRPS